MDNISHKILTILLFAVLLIMEKTGFVTGFFDSRIIIGSILILLMDFLVPVMFNDGSSKLKDNYRRCSLCSVIFFLALTIHALLRHLSVRFSFSEDPFVIPVYIIAGFLECKYLLPVFIGARKGGSQ